jgi:hypothetical protein
MLDAQCSMLNERKRSINPRSNLLRSHPHPPLLKYERFLHAKRVKFAWDFRPCAPEVTRNALIHRNPDFIGRLGTDPA